MLWLCPAPCLNFLTAGSEHSVLRWTRCTRKERVRKSTHPKANKNKVMRHSHQTWLKLGQFFNRTISEDFRGTVSTGSLLQHVATFTEWKTRWEPTNSGRLHWQSAWAKPSPARLKHSVWVLILNQHISTLILSILAYSWKTKSWAHNSSLVPDWFAFRKAKCRHDVWMAMSCKPVASLLSD